MLKKLLLLAAIAVLNYSIVSAQTPPLLKDASIALNPSSAQGYFNGIFDIVVNDTLNIEKFEIALGTDADSSDLLNTTIDFDVPSGAPTGFIYMRDGYHISISTSDFAKQNTYFGYVKAKTSSSAFEDPRKFVAN